MASWKAVILVHLFSLSVFHILATEIKEKGGWKDNSESAFI